MESQRPIAAATIVPVDAEKAALNSITVELGVTTRSAVADEVVKTAVAPTPPSGNGIRVLTLAEYKAAAYSLAEAFWEDHSSMYFIRTPDRAERSEEQNWDLHLKIMEYITYAHLLKGLVISAGPNYDCVALWMPPGSNMDDPLTLLRSGMWRLSYQLSAEGRKRFFSEFLPLLNDTKAQVLGPRDQDSWYLVYIGTKPAGRGKGYARAAIEYVTSRADAKAKACYLESSHAVNRAIYARLGFAMRKMVFLQRGSELVQLDIMVREPVAKDGEGKGSDADSGVEIMK